MAAGYDRAASVYDRCHQDSRSQQRFAIIDRPQRRAARRARRVLELGCGTGRLLTTLDAPVCIGVDVSAAMLSRSHQRIRDRGRQRDMAVVRADAHALPFADSSFDAVLAPKGVFRYLDLSSAMRECARVLTLGGCLVVHQYAARTWSAWLLREQAVRLASAGRRIFGRAYNATCARSEHGSHDDRAERASNDRCAGNGNVTYVEHLEELYRPARAVGLEPRSTYLWRSVRVPPYALAIPSWLPGRFWSHCTVVFRRSRLTL